MQTTSNICSLLRGSFHLPRVLTTELPSPAIRSSKHCCSHLDHPTCTFHLVLCSYISLVRLTSIVKTGQHRYMRSYRLLYQHEPNNFSHINSTRTNITTTTHPCIVFNRAAHLHSQHTQFALRFPISATVRFPFVLYAR